MKIEPVLNTQEKTSRLQAELAKARQAQMAAEAELTQEQAAVNAFRMHCRLKLDKLVDETLALRAEKQAILTHLAILRQGEDMAWLDEDDDLLEEDYKTNEWSEEKEELLLPTPVPHDKAAEKRLYRELARRFHPDLSRTATEVAYRTEMMASVNKAYAVNDLQALYDLAGELEPGEIAELAGIESAEIRHLREGILTARHRRRKARRQLELLHQENTARLWRRAQLLEGQQEDWWSLVQRKLEAAVAHRQAELARLKSQLDAIESGSSVS